MKRVVGIALFGLGVLFLVLAAGLPLYVAPAATKLPYDLGKTESVVEAQNATVLQVKAGTPIIHTNKELRSTTTVVPQPKLAYELRSEFGDKAVVWDVYSSTVLVESGEKVSESSTEIALDRVSATPVDWSGAFVNDGTKTTTKFTGQIYKFPFHTEKRDYAFWDGEMGSAAPPARFEAVETVNGLEAYRFKQVVPWFKTDTDPTSRAVLLSNFAKTATTGDIWYRNTRTLWVEPVTGQFLNVREEREQEFRDDDGGTTTLLRADLSYTKETQAKSADGAKSNKLMIQAVSLYGPIVLGVLGVILVIVGPLMTRRRTYQPEHSSGAE